MHEYGFFIGRFQPVHNGHIKIITEALEKVNKLILFIGSASLTRTIKNPFLVEERIKMISSSLSPEQASRIIFVPLVDYENDNDWSDKINEEIDKLTNQSVALFGYYKDSSSTYLSWFPKCIPQITTESHYNNLSSTPIRNLYFSDGIIDENNLHKCTTQFLKDFQCTEMFKILAIEYASCKKH